MKKLITVKEAAEKTGYSTRTIHRWIHECGLTAVRKKPRGAWRIAESDLEAWLEPENENGNG